MDQKVFSISCQQQIVENLIIEANEKLNESFEEEVESRKKKKEFAFAF